METHTAPPVQDFNAAPLNERLKLWRKGQNDSGEKMTLHQAKNVLGISIGYISDLEAGKLPIGMKVYKKYNHADPVRFPVADVGLLL